MKYWLAVSSLFYFTSLTLAQNDTLNSKPKVVFSAYMDIYYCYDFSNPSDNLRPNFVYSFNKANQINVNLAYGKLNFTDGPFRLNAAVMAGTYSQANLADEPGVTKNIFEANAGFKLLKKKNLWLDGGIFESYIGFESAMMKDCWNLTRSILADNSPYYDSGVKLTGETDNEKLTASVLILNGWQHIKPVPGNTLPSFGWQLTYTPNEKFTVNSSAYAGPQGPDTSRQMRYFHNFYAIYQPLKEIGFTFGFDAGLQQSHYKSKTYDGWYAPIFMVRYTPITQVALAFRYEFYCDPSQVIIETNTPDGFQTQGLSLNFDWIIEKHIMWRAEGKMYSSRDAIFTLDNGPSRQNYSITTAFTFSF